MKRLLFGALSLFLSSNAWGYYSTLDTGALMKDGQYRLGVETQFVTEGDSGVNVGFRLDGPIDDEFGWRALGGFGTTDFFAGALFKWVPVPDLETQPAIGVLVGPVFANINGHNVLNIRANPFVSKKFELEFGAWTPYATLPVGLRIADHDTEFTAQIGIGTQFQPTAWPHLGMWAELGFDIHEAYPYFSLNATLEWDEESGLQFP